MSLNYKPEVAKFAEMAAYLKEKGLYPDEGFPEDSPYSAEEIKKFDNFLEENSCSDGFWYGLTCGGYISPDTFYDEESCNRVYEALDLLSEFEGDWHSLSAEM